MDLDALLYHYFGTEALETLDEAAIDSGLERLRIDFGTERESSRRFALWVLLHSLGAAPDPATAFKDARERQAAETYARAADQLGRDS
ncbi:hypothetical protein [Sphingomonas alpina]|uniref:Uncharacterized protein n=1 Tax=Sphingomonas alpina TaxID=653931 RepID=A0A7H0LH18_9SPHN|nr:hypothetical protein [Sphingomonas alpina]QNQ08971.1 hypothetical protein H3Z74_20080 [Sphingomonas alpina]